MKVDFYINNRTNLAKSIQGGIVCISSYQRMQYVNDMFAPFKQESNFLYLCGITEPGWQLIIDGSRGKSWLVCPQVSLVHETFDGVLNPHDARIISGVDSVIDVKESEALLRELARKHSVAYTIDQPSWIKAADFAPNPALQRNRKKLERMFASVHQCNKELAKLRSIKQPEELAAIQNAIDLTIKAFNLTYKNMNNYKYEYEIEADFTHTFRRNGSEGHAYEPIVAFGKNACTLHYIKNKDKLAGKHLTLLDVGASSDGYAADITRTYAKVAPTHRQAQIHQAVQQAQANIISILRPGLRIVEYQQAVDESMQAALSSLGLLNGDTETALRTYMPHAISHGLGLDVHDSLGGASELLPGMVLTVEPGIYVADEAIGVRIEDDILITDSGHKNLSRKLPTHW